MKLPSVGQAVVDREKILDYLLNAGHPDNGGKAKFFDDLGFRLDKWEALAEGLRVLASVSPVMQRLESSHGWKYVIGYSRNNGYAERKVAEGTDGLDSESRVRGASLDNGISI